MLSAFSSTLRALTGWRRNLAAFILGVFCTLTLAPFYLFPLLILSFSGLFLLVDSAPSRRRLFADGWWWGWGFHMTGLYWFCIALLTDPDKFAWLIPFALFGLTGVIALYAGVACWLMGWLRVRGLTRVFVFSVVWTCVEWARGHLFTGFPWNLAGYAFGFSDASLQMASLAGAYGLTFFAVLLGASPAVRGRGKPMFLVALWGLFAAGVGWGVWRLEHAQADPGVPGVTLRLVQANIAQHHKWEPGRQMDGLREHIRLTRSPGLEKVTHVIWPETATPYMLKGNTPLAHLLGSAIPEKSLLITGALREEGGRIWNSLMALNHAGEVVGAYDKVRLVPFGEFLPFRALLPESWLTPVGDTDFSAGPKGQVVRWPGLPAALPLICYEVIFPEMSMAPGEDRPGWLLSVTNDAWFGLSTGPRQHFEMARMRAVEQGLPLVRVANTGISAVMDGYGRVRARLELGRQGILDTALPSALDDTTFNIGNKFFIPLLIFFAALLTLRQYKAIKN